MLFMIVFANTNAPFTNDYIRYAKDYLASKNIEINADIPRVPSYTGKVLYSTKKYNTDALCRLVFGLEIPLSESENKIYMIVGDEMLILSEDELYIKDKLPDGELWFGDLKTFENKLIRYLENIGFNKSNLWIEKSLELEDTKEIIFTLKYRKLHVFDQKITAQLNKEGILILSAPTKEIKNENGTGQILSAYQILIMGGLTPSTKAVKIDIGYRRISEGDIYGVPVWRIIADDGTILFYNGFTGEKLD